MISCASLRISYLVSGRRWGASSLPVGRISAGVWRRRKRGRRSGHLGLWKFANQRQNKAASGIRVEVEVTGAEGYPKRRSLTTFVVILWSRLSTQGMGPELTLEPHRMLGAREQD